MINIIKDFDDILNKKGAIEVIDDSSFLISRMMISDQKEKRFKDDIDIIIKNSKYQFGYNDLNHLKDFVIFGEINLVEILEEQLSIDLKGLSNRDILSTGINKNLQIFINSYDKKYNYFQNVIMFNFEIEDTDDLKHMDKAIKFILDNIKMIEKMKENRNSTLQYLKNEIKDLSSREDFLWFINILDYDTDVKEYMKIIIFNHIFKNYKEFEKEILNKPKGYRNIDISICSNIYRKLLNSNNEYLEELNLELIKKEKQLYLFNSLDNNFSNFISRVTGVLKHEFNFVIEFIIHKISNKDFMDIEKVEALIFKTETKFEYLIYQDNRAKKTIYLLKNLINKIKTLNSMEKEMGNLVTIEKWFDFYTTKYMIIKNDLDKDNNIYEIIDNIVEDNRIRISLKQRVNLIIDKINKQYETFLYNNFDNIHRQNMGKYSILSALSKISKYSNEKTVLLVIDAMRWDIWEIAQNILEGHGYVQENKDDFLVAMIPTITSISRLSLFSGNKYKTIIDEKMNNVYEYDYRDESKHLKRFFKGKKVGFTIGGKEKFNRLMDKDLDIYAFIYSESDAVLHGLTDINKDIIYYILKEQIDNIIKEVENRFDDKFNIVVTTDHGTIDIKNSKGIYLENTVTSYLKNYSINYSNHGKYIRIFSMDSIDKENYDEIHSYFKDLDYFHIITIEDMTKYYLPKKEKDEYNLFYLICKYKYHIGSTTRSTNTHGGFSMNETLIPFAVFQKELENIKELDIVIISNLVYKTNSKLTIKVINPNDFNIRNINLSIKPFINKYKIDFIKRESSIEFEINIIPEVHGTVDLNTTIDYEKLGREIHETKTIQIDVKEDLKTRISKDIKKSRRLDF